MSISHVHSILSTEALDTYVTAFNSDDQELYATDMVPLLCGELPFAAIHRELTSELVALDGLLAQRATA